MSIKNNRQWMMKRIDNSLLAASPIKKKTKDKDLMGLVSIKKLLSSTKKDKDLSDLIKTEPGLEKAVELLTLSLREKRKKIGESNKTNASESGRSWEIKLFNKYLNKEYKEVITLAKPGDANNLDLIKKSKQRILDQIKKDKQTTRTSPTIIQRLNEENELEEHSLSIETKTYIAPFNVEITYTYTHTQDGDNFGTHLQAGDYLNMHKLKLIRRIFEAKKPVLKDPYVGVEIEFFCKMPQNQLAQVLGKYDLYNFVQLKRDSSIRPTSSKPYEHELTILATEKQIKDVVTRVIKALKEAHAEVNNSCGLHVHLDMRNRNYKTIFHNLVSAQDMLFSMNSRARIQGIYTKKVTSTNFDEMAANGDRRYGINSQALRKLNTLEIRIHSGSVNQVKILNWISILVTIANHSTSIKTTCSTASQFKEIFNVTDESLISYIQSRINKFNPTGNSHISIEEKEIASEESPDVVVAASA